MRAIPQLVSAPLNPIPTADHFRRSHPPCEHSHGQHVSIFYYVIRLFIVNSYKFLDFPFFLYYFIYVFFGLISIFLLEV